MRFLTYNIWNYHRPWRERRAQIVAIIQTHRPDVVALQETRHDFRYERSKGQGEQIAELAGYHCTWAVGQVYFPLLRVDEGLTVLTREPPLQVMKKELTLYPHERGDDNQRVCLGVRVRHESGEVDVFDAHFSLSEIVRVHNAVESFRFIRDQSGERPAFLMGDLNTAPDTRPIRFLLGQQEVDGDSGDFVDCWTRAHPDDPGFTYASWDPYHRIDFVLGRNIGSRAVSAERVGLESRNGTYPSDHVGILVDVV
jgi:endonuclease/exonuclease/phosphatase family metal-dependent hydrolase